MEGVPKDIYSKSREELIMMMLDCKGPDAILYIVVSDVLKIKHTEQLVRKTWILAIATWVLVGATIMAPYFIGGFLCK